jgi:hypothetical protein
MLGKNNQPLVIVDADAVVPFIDVGDEASLFYQMTPSGHVRNLQLYELSKNTLILV